MFTPQSQDLPQELLQNKVFPQEDGLWMTHISEGSKDNVCIGLW